MKALESAANDLLDGHEAGLDPMTILVVIQVIIEIVKMWQSCFGECESKQVTDYLSAGGPVMQRVRKRWVARHIVRTLGRDEFDLLGGMAFIDKLFAYAKDNDLEPVITEALAR